MDEEEELEHELEAQPDLVWRSSRQRNPLERYGYSLDNWRCIFSLNANIDEPRSIEEALSMNDSQS